MLAAALEVAVEAEDRTVDSWGLEWLKGRKKDGRHREAADDLRRWKRTVSKSHIASKPLVALSSRDIRQWLDRMRTKDDTRPNAQTAKNALSLLRVSLEAACDAGHLQSNPAFGIRISATLRAHQPKAGKPRLTVEELDRFLWSTGAVPLHQQSILVVMATMGLSPAEAWALKWEHVNLRTGTLEVRKLKRKARWRKLDLVQPAQIILERWQAKAKGDGLVWPGRALRPHARGYDARIGEVVAAAGLQGRGVTIGALRGNAGSMLLTGAWVERGWLTKPLTITEVSKWLGHSAPEVTAKHYARLLDEEVRASVVRKCPAKPSRGDLKNTKKAEPPSRLELLTYGLRKPRDGTTKADREAPDGFARDSLRDTLGPLAERLLVGVVERMPEAEWKALAVTLAIEVRGAAAKTEALLLAAEGEEQTG